MTRDAKKEQDAVVAEYARLSGESRKLYARACRVFPSGCTRRTVYFPPYPSYIVRGEGCRIYDVDGNAYIDYTNNYGPLILGHNPPEVAEAIRRQLSCGTVLGGPTEVEIELAEEIVKTIPSAEQVIFCASGSEANMVGLRALRAFTGKKKILRCAGAYHGSTEPFVQGPGVPEEVRGMTVTVPYNDVDQLEEAVRKHKHELAAVFMEPVMRGIPPEGQYLLDVRRITREHGVPLVFDEVVTGFRLRRGGAQEKWKVAADLTVLGKIIGGGIGIGAVASSKRLLSAFGSKRARGVVCDAPTIGHGGTYNAHPVAMVAGLATLRSLTARTYEHLEAMGEQLRQGMRRTLERAGIRVQVVGISSIFNVYFTDRRVTDATSARSASVHLQRLLDLNMIVRGVYPAKAHCSFVSTPIMADEVKRTVEAFEESLSSMIETIRSIAPNLC